MKANKVFILLLFFPIILLNAQGFNHPSHRMLGDFLVNFGEIDSTDAENATLIVADCHNNPVDFDFNALCRETKQDTILSFHFGNFKTPSFTHILLYSNKKLYPINMNQSLDIVLKDVFWVLRTVKVGEDTIFNIIHEVVVIHKSNDYIDPIFGEPGCYEPLKKPRQSKN